jgi:predicted O-linked N-acetylglucosamine transferase (SPINDLY family)
MVSTKDARVATYVAAGDINSAINLIKRKLRIKRDSTSLYNLGLLYAYQENYAKSSWYLEQARALTPNDPEIINQIAYNCIRLADFSNAERLLKEVLERIPDNVLALMNLGNLTFELGRYNDCIDVFRRLVPIASDASIHVALCSALVEAKQLESAGLQLTHSLEKFPDASELNILKLTLLRLGKNLSEHEELANKLASAHSADLEEIDVERGYAALARNDSGVAVSILNGVLQRSPTHISALRALVRTYVASNNYSAAFSVLDQRKHEIGNDSRFDDLLCYFYISAANIGKYDISEKISRILYEKAKQGKYSLLDPLIGLYAFDDPGLHKRVAESHCQDRNARKVIIDSVSSENRRIRVGYLSGDLHEHPVAYLAVGLIENHDKEYFEIFLFSLAGDELSRYRSRLKASADHFFDCESLTVSRSLELIRNSNLDVLIDLSGHTRNTGLHLMRTRLSPVQVSFLGYPGTTGARWIDYLITDKTLTPEGDESYFTETLLRLDRCYQPNEALFELPSDSTRSRWGLPDDPNIFIFCTFNAQLKINVEVIAAWSEILKLAPFSVLWLLRRDTQSEENIAQVFKDFGIEKERLIFAEQVSRIEHLGRLSLGCLFLDTWPYCAHTTASDAIRVGLPVLTKIGNSFQSRVSASILNALGPDIGKGLVVGSVQEYIERAVDFYLNRNRLIELRSLINQATAHSKLFNPKSYARDFETLLQKALENKPIPQALSSTHQ